MEQIDPSIAMGFRPPQIESPVNALAKVLQLKGLQQEHELNALNMDEKRRGFEQQNALARLMTPDFSWDDPVKRNQAFSAAPLKAQELYGKHVDLQGKQITNKKNAADFANQRIAAYRDNIGLVRDPQTAVQYVTQLYNDPELKDTAITRVPLEQLLSGIPQDPAQLEAWKQQFALGATDFIKQNKPTIQQVDSGQVKSIVAVPGLGGTPTTLQSVQKVATPGELLQAQTTRRGQDLTDARQREGLQVQRDAARSEVKETAEGFVLIDKGTKQVTPLLGADGKPLTPKLKNAPPAVQQAVLTNAQNLARAERALTLVEGRDIGDPKNGGQKGDKDATGWKGYVPNPILNRMDPKGVDARAAIADLGSLIIHDRSGAAVTAAEFPRLQPFIPNEKDDPETVKKKLRRFVHVYREELGFLQHSYGPDTGYRPVTPAPAAAPPTVTNW